jgi:hypothetical protein
MDGDPRCPTCRPQSLRASDRCGMAAGSVGGPLGGEEVSTSLAMIMNTAFAGVPAAFAASGSAWITLIAAVVAVAGAGAYLAARHR